MTIYEAIDESYFGEVKLFPRTFINLFRNDPNETQIIPTDTTKENMALEESLYAQVTRIFIKV